MKDKTKSKALAQRKSASRSPAEAPAAASGNYGAATASGNYGRVKGVDGCALFLVERGSSMNILHVWAGIAGKDGIKADTFYTLKGGKPVEV